MSIFDDFKHLSSHAVEPFDYITQYVVSPQYVADLAVFLADDKERVTARLIAYLVKILPVSSWKQSETLVSINFIEFSLPPVLQLRWLTEREALQFKKDLERAWNKGDAELQYQDVTQSLDVRFESINRRRRKLQCEESYRLTKLHESRPWTPTLGAQLACQANQFATDMVAAELEQLAQARKQKLTAAFGSVIAMSYNELLATIAWNLIRRS